MSNEKKEAVKLAEAGAREELFFTGAPKVGLPGKLILWSITGAVVLALFFAITHLFRSAEVSVTEKSLSIALPESMTLYLNPKEGEAGYSPPSLNDSAKEEVIATGEKEMKSQASGALVIYNNFSSATQKLVTSTRFETPSGLIFRLNKDVVVPGTSKVNGKTVPGSIEATVTDDKPGAEYNVGLSDFTIPGFKGDSRYSAFYGRSKTAMTGGNVGKVASIDDAVLQNTVSALKEKLKAALLVKALEQMPATQQTLEGFDRVSYVEGLPKSLGSAGAGKAEVRVDASAKIYAIDVLSFAKKILAAGKNATSSTEAFALDFSSAEVSLGDEANGSLPLTLTGNVVVTWKLNTEAFKSAVAGKSVKEVASISTSFPEISKVSVVVKPFSFWSSSLPSNTEKISVSFDK